MRDINYILRKAYFTALNGMQIDSNDVPVYAFQAPSNVSADYYVVFRLISNTDNSTSTSADTETSMQVAIHTFGNSSNSGRNSEKIANEVYERIYANTTAVLDLTAENCQMISTSLVNDLTNEISVEGDRFYLDRFITFRHHIFINN